MCFNPVMCLRPPKIRYSWVDLVRTMPTKFAFPTKNWRAENVFQKSGIKLNLNLNLKQTFCPPLSYFTRLKSEKSWPRFSTTHWVAVETLWFENGTTYWKIKHTLELDDCSMSFLSEFSIVQSTKFWEPAATIITPGHEGRENLLKHYNNNSAAQVVRFLANVNSSSGSLYVVCLLYTSPSPRD